MAHVHKVTETGVVLTGKVFLSSASLIPGSTAATLVLNDSTDGTGDDHAAIKTTTGLSLTDHFTNGSAHIGLVFENGVYATITGTGAVAYIYIA